MNRRGSKIFQELIEFQVQKKGSQNLKGHRNSPHEFNFGYGHGVPCMLLLRCCRSRVTGGWRQPEIHSTATLTCLWATRFTTDVLKSLQNTCLIISELVAAWSQRHGALRAIRLTFDRFLDRKMSGWRVPRPWSWRFLGRFSGFIGNPIGNQLETIKLKPRNLKMWHILFKFVFITQKNLLIGSR